MKIYIQLFLFFTFSTICFGQSAKYAELVKQADHFYRIKNYKTSALTYSKAFKLNKWKVSPEDRYNAACSWALADVSDSAFYQLNFIAIKNNYSRAEQLTGEKDFKSLRRDKRWKPLLEVINQNKERQEAKLNKPLVKILDSIHEKDQKYRIQLDEIEANHPLDTAKWKNIATTMFETDTSNLRKIETIISHYGWLGKDVIGNQGNTTLFLVIQHSDLTTQEKYLPLMEEAVKNGNAEPDQLAYLEDRVALNHGKKQIYGSQLIKDLKTGKSVFAPIEDSMNVDKRRASVGLEPLKDYASRFGIEYNHFEKKESKGKVLIKSISNDFATAEEIHDSIVGPVNVTYGFGKQKDFSISEVYNERNSAWFKFTIDIDTVLTFDIVPNDPKADYDFILFKCLKPDCINDIRSSKVKPDRWCFSVNYDKNGSTGLSDVSLDTYLGAGPGLGYVSGLDIKAGETIYLMVNWPYDGISKGFTIYFYNYWPNKPKELIGRNRAGKIRAEPIVLENVFFESDKAVLAEGSQKPLDQLVIQLFQNKTMKIEVRGYTDNVGDEESNQKLSEDRAKAIVDYLSSKRIEKDRLSFKGFGSKDPIASNDSEEGKKKNRRVEFVILTK
jgi:flagellar motor protein MotB